MVRMMMMVVLVRLVWLMVSAAGAAAGPLVEA